MPFIIFQEYIQQVGVNRDLLDQEFDEKTPMTMTKEQKINSDLVRERNRWINESIYG